MKIKFKGLNLKLGDKKNRLFLCIFCIILFLLFVAVAFWMLVKKSEVTYLVEMGNLEYSTLADAYVIKEETVIARDKSKTLIPVISEGQKVAKGGILATYKNSEYDTYVVKLEEMDEEIMSLMQDLPVVYSGEIESVENQIRTELKSALGITSYVEMQNSINKINNLINKRAVMVGELSPAGASIKELISKRNEFEETMKKSNDNVIATATGIVSYSTDGLEEKVNIENLNNLTFDSIKNMVENKSIDNNIKIINNYTCNFIARTQNISEDFLKYGRIYSIKIVGDTKTVLDAELISYTLNKETGYADLVFEIHNNIENIALLRNVELEIVWWNKSGLYIPNNALEQVEEINYVKIIKYGKYVDVPVKVKNKNETYCIVENYTQEELDELNLESDYSLKLYDKIVINK